MYLKNLSKDTPNVHLEGLRLIMYSRKMLNVSVKILM